MPVNRKRVQRIMRQHQLLQPTRHTGRRQRPGFFQVTRPGELWYMDMTKLWVAQHDWTYLHAIIDCCTREITVWTLDLRARTKEAVACLDHALAQRAIARSAPTTARNSPADASAAISPTVASRTNVAATATPNPRPSSSRGSASSRNGSPGAPNGKPSTTPERRSPPTSTGPTQ